MPQYISDGDQLVDPLGQIWTIVAEWLEPDEVLYLVSRGAILSVSWCDKWEWDVSLRDDIKAMMADTVKSHSLAGRRNKGKVILASSFWVSEPDRSRRLVVLAEETAKRKEVIAEFSRLPVEHRRSFGR